MYTKLFSHITESTIWHEDDSTRIVWITLLAMCDRDGFVHSSILGVASRARVELDNAKAAVEKFLAPDSESMSKEHEGRRIEVVEGGWRLLNYVKYREMKNSEERRSYMREYMRKKRSVNTPLANVSTVSPSDSDSDTKAKSKVKPRFAPPSLEEVTSYCKERKNQVDPQKWLDYYTSNGFRVGRTAMKDWQAAVRTWEKNGFSNGGNGDNHKTAAQLRNERSSAALDRAFSETRDPEDEPGALFKGTKRGRV